MLEESPARFLLRWYFSRRWRSSRRYPERLAELKFHKMMLGLPRNGVFVDLGANIGDVTAAVRKYGYQVIAFEPDPAALSALRQRFAQDPKVSIIPKAIGGLARKATFRHVPHFTQASSLAEYVQLEDGIDNAVDVVGIVDFIRNIGRPVAGIKMDIEGAEAECLEAMLDAGIYRSVGHILVECHDRFSNDLARRLDAIRTRIESEKIKNIDLGWM